jgi:hypothetical protein
MREQLIDTPEDCDWLQETHLKGTSDGHGERFAFASAVIRGNEDCPQEIELYVSSAPRMTDGCVRLVYDAATDTYRRY